MPWTLLRVVGRQDARSDSGTQGDEMIGTLLAQFRITEKLGADSVRFGDTTQLFDVASPEITGPSFAPSADCQRFLVTPKNETSGTTPLNLMVGWPQILEESS